MVYSDASLRIKELFLKYGFECHIATKKYAGWHSHQDWQVEFLLRNGLKPTHNFLDIGCGWLRLAYGLLPYLEPGRYFGIDSSKVHLQIGREMLQPTHWDARPTLLCDEAFSFERFQTLRKLSS